MYKFLVLALFVVSSAVAEEHCLNAVDNDCSGPSVGIRLDSCNALFGGYSRNSVLEKEMQAYANSHLLKSFEYLLSSAYYNGYLTNRAGFSKLFKKLSDQSWKQGIELIKHITQRGGAMDFNQRSKHLTAQKNTLELYELQALARALDTQKELAKHAFAIHQDAIRNHQDLHDAEIAQYLEEEFIESQTKTIRNLAGYASDLKKFASEDKGKDLSLALYVFDEYLQKTL